MEQPLVSTLENNILRDKTLNQAYSTDDVLLSSRISHNRRKRKKASRSTASFHQSSTKKMKHMSQTIHDNVGINFASNSAFLLGNMVLSSFQYNNLTITNDPYAIKECPWKSVLSSQEPSLDDEVFKQLQKEFQSSNNNTKTNPIDPYCTIMSTGGVVFSEDSGSSTLLYNVILHDSHSQFLNLQLITHTIFRNVYVVYGRFGTIGQIGNTYTRMFNNAKQAKQFFWDSLRGLLSHDAATSPNVHAVPKQTHNKVFYLLPSLPIHQTVPSPTIV